MIIAWWFALLSCFGLVPSDGHHPLPLSIAPPPRSWRRQRAAVGGPLNVAFIVDHTYSAQEEHFFPGHAHAWMSVALPLCSAGHRVTVLFVSGTKAEWGKLTYRQTLHRFGGLNCSENLHLLQLPEPKRTYSTSEQVSLAYETFLWLQSRTEMDVAYFLSWGGLGYFPSLVKQQGVAFEDTLLVNLLHGIRSWFSEQIGGEGTFCNVADMETSFMERASVELADAVIAPHGSLVGWLSARGWKLPERCAEPPARAS